ncbi:MAG: hypothetical protein WBI08_03955 [Bacteroidales bacterium]
MEKKVNSKEKQDTANKLCKNIIANVCSYLYTIIEDYKIYEKNYNLTVKKRGESYIICYNLLNSKKDKKDKKDIKKDSKNYYEITIRTLKNNRVLVNVNIDGYIDTLSLKALSSDLVNMDKVINAIKKLIEKTGKI